MKWHLSFIAALGMYFFASITAADAQQVRADTGSIAIGGSVTGSTVIIGIPQEKVEDFSQCETPAGTTNHSTEREHRLTQGKTGPQ